MKMVQRQKAIIQGLFLATKKTYHRLADEAGIGDRPDKFEDLGPENYRGSCEELKWLR